ncbi:MAG: hypothetical protein WCG28_03735, partial [bacterium]
GTGAGVINSIVVNFVEEEVIPAGKTQTYTLKAYASNFGPSSSSGSDSISTYIPSDTSMLDGGSYLKTVFSKFYHGLSKINLDSSSVNYYNLLWSDMSETFPNTRNNFNGSYTKDWYNGFGILNLPLTTQAVNAQ